MSDFQYRVQQYSPGTGVLLGPAPIPMSIEAAAPLNDFPSLSATLYGPAGALRAPTEVAIEVSTDGAATWSEPPNMRFSVLGDATDRLKAGAYPTLKCVGMIWQLKKAVVQPMSGPFDADGRRLWATITAGALIRTLIQEAQSRGVLNWLDMSTFSSTLDSNGTAWPTTFTTSHELGISYDTVLFNLADAGLIDFQMVGRSLRCYVADTFLAPASTGVTLVEGRDFTEANEQVTYELVASKNFIRGDGISTVVTDAAADKPWGEWEVYTSASGSTNLSDLNTLADLGSARSSIRQTQRTFTVYPNASASSPKPYLDFKLGDTVAAQTNSILESNLRIRQITVRGDGASAQCTLILGDRLLEREIRLSRKLTAAAGGIGGAGSGGTLPVDPGGTADSLAPNPPTTMGFSSTAVLINGATVADLTVSWTAPTTNTNGTILDDLDHFEVQTKRTALGANYWEAGGTTTLTVLTVGALVPGASYDARVRAVDKSANVSTWLTGTFTTNMDGTAPNQPSVATVVNDLGLLFVYWNGKDNLGNNPPSDFSYLRVDVSTSSGFTPGPTTIRDTIVSPLGGRVPLGDLVYDTTYFIKTAMVDLAGNVSTFSTQVSGIPTRVTGLDIAALTIATSNLGDGAVTSIKIVDAAITSAKIGNLQVLNAAIAALAVDDAKIANCSIGKLTVGILNADMTLSAKIKTGTSGARVELGAFGLRAYNSGNVQTYLLDATTGSTVQTGTFQTGVSGQRIVIDPSGNGTMYFYPATGSDYSFINAPSSNSVGINSGTGGLGHATRLYLRPDSAEFMYMTQPGQDQAGGYFGINTNSAYISSGPGGSSINVGSGGSWLSVDSGIGGGTSGDININGNSVLLGANNNKYLSMDTSSTVDLMCGGNTYIRMSTTTIILMTRNGAGIGALKIPVMATTGIAPNMYLQASDGQVYYNNSSRTIKERIEDIDLNLVLSGIQKLRPRSFYDKRQYDEMDGDVGRLSKIVGLVAEEVEEIGEFNEFLVDRQVREIDGEELPPSVDYRGVGVLLVPAVQYLLREVNKLKIQRN